MASMAEKLRAKRKAGGRPPREGVVRYPGGEIVKAEQRPIETREQIMAVALAAPHRKLTSEPGNRMAGYASGRLYLTGAIDKRQYEALERYSRTSLRYMRLVLGRTPKWPEMALERTSPSSSDSPEPDENDVAALKREHADMLWAISDATGSDYQLARQTMFGAGVLDREPGSIPEMAAMHTALNALGRLWMLGSDS